MNTQSHPMMASKLSLLRKRILMLVIFMNEGCKISKSWCFFILTNTLSLKYRKKKKKINNKRSNKTTISRIQTDAQESIFGPISKGKIHQYIGIKKVTKVRLDIFNKTIFFDTGWIQIAPN